MPKPRVAPTPALVALGLLAVLAVLLPGYARIAALGGLAAGVILLGIRLGVDSVQRELDIRYRRAEAWLAIYSVIRPRIPFPTIQVYMATPELLRHVVHLTLERRPALVVELGSGISTVLAAYCLEQLGQGRIVSVDHEERFRDATRELLARHGLEHRVRLVHAPLVPVESGDHRSRWYDPAIVRAAIEAERAEVGLLLVDGPPGKDQALARLPALLLLQDLLASEVVVLVDDARRDDEQEMVRRWRARFPGFSSEEFETEKGAVVLRRRA